MTKIFITYHPNWTDGLASWADSKYSPDLTNLQKIQANLKKLDSMGRSDWQQNMQLIKHIAPGEFENDIYIHVENLKLADSYIVLSMTINAPHQSTFFCEFILSSTLNLDSIYSVERIMNTKSKIISDQKALSNTKLLSDDTDSNTNHNNDYECVYDETVNVDNWRNKSIHDIDCDDDDPDDEKFLYQLVLKESPQVTADKALSKRLEWYSFFLPDEKEEDTAQKDNPVIVSGSMPACMQMNK